MPNQPGWLSLLATIRERFEAILSDQITLTLYVSPDPADPQGPSMPSALGDKFENQYLAGGTFPAGSFYHELSSYSFFANPIAPNWQYRSIQVNYYNSTANLCKEAWAILPADLRRTAVGASDSTGWFIVVFRVLMASGVGMAMWNPAMAKIEGDFAKASVIAIRLLEQKGLGAIILDIPSEIKPFAIWLHQRAQPFQDWLKDTNAPFSLPYIHEINDLLGPPMPGRANILHYWMCNVQPDYIRYLIANSHRVLERLAISGLPAWQDEPLDHTWGERASAHLTALSEIMHAHNEGKPAKTKQKNTSKSADKLSDRQLDIIGFLWEKKAINVGSRQQTREIADVILGKNLGADGLKRPISDLKRLGLIDTKTGSGGGCWLSPQGIALASNNNPKL
jgi:hypothetical protein